MIKPYEELGCSQRRPYDRSGVEFIDLVFLAGSIGVAAIAASAPFILRALRRAPDPYDAVRGEVAARLGLAPRDGPLLEGCYGGLIDAHPIDLARGFDPTRPFTEPLPSVRIHGVPPDVFIVPYEALPLTSSDEIEICDPELDATIAVRGPERRLRAALDAEHRALVRELAPRINVRGGRIECLLPTGTDADRMASVVVRLVGLATSLARPEEDLLFALGEVATRDPLVSVRLACVASVPLDEPLPSNFERALHDTSAKVRLATAQRIGASARTTLENLVADAAAGSAQRAAAIEAVMRDLDPAGRVRLLESITPARLPDPVLVAYLSAVGTYAIADLAQHVPPYFASEAPEVRAAAAAAAARVGDATWEPRLLPYLDEGELDDVVVAVCDALSVFGTADSVGPLVELSKGLLKSRAVRRAASAAVAAIQARAGESGPGRLSIAEDGDGAVSLATDDGGALSLKDGATSGDGGR